MALIHFASMTQSTPPHIDDNLTKFIAVLVPSLPILLKALGEIPAVKRRRKRKKAETDEHEIVKAIVQRDKVIDDLEKKIAYRDNQIREKEIEIKRLRIFENESETLQAINKTLSTYNDNLQKENTELSIQVDSLRKLPTRKIEPPDMLDTGDGKPSAPPP